MNRDQLWGRLGKARARMQEVAGTLLFDRTLIRRARADFIASSGRTEFGDAKSAIEETRLLRRHKRLGHPR